MKSNPDSAMRAVVDACRTSRSPGLIVAVLQQELYVYMCIRLCVCTYMHMCVSRCIHTVIHIHVRIHIHIHIHMHTQKKMCIYPYTSLYVYMHICIVIICVCQRPKDAFQSAMPVQA